MEKTCDHRSVGVIIRNEDDDYLLLTRAKPPSGRAPVAGHVDEHGDWLAAAVAETVEEVGVRAAGRLNYVADGTLPNICRRTPTHPVPGHAWMIYQAVVPLGTVIRPDAEETRGAAWYTPQQLQELAEVTVLWCTGGISDKSWYADPGLEPVWVHWLAVTGHIQISDRGLAAVREVYSNELV